MSDGYCREYFGINVLGDQLSQVAQSMPSFTDSFYRILLIPDFVPGAVTDTGGRVTKTVPVPKEGCLFNQDIYEPPSQSQPQDRPSHSSGPRAGEEGQGSLPLWVV